MASGDPLPDRHPVDPPVTDPRPTGRAPDPARPGPLGGGRDEAFSNVVATGLPVAEPALAHSVHVTPPALSPPPGTGTASSAGDRPARPAAPAPRLRRTPTPERLRFAFASCQHCEAGLLDRLRPHGRGRPRPGRPPGRLHLRGRAGYGTTGVRKHAGAEIMTLADYRTGTRSTRPTRSAGAHAACPWLVTWDDHEVENNYAGDVPEKAAAVDPAEFLERRAAAYQAYYEHMPLRRRSLPDGPDMQLYRRCLRPAWPSSTCSTPASTAPTSPRRRRQPPLTPTALTASAPARRRAGGVARRRRWPDSTATWNVLAQQVMMAPLVDRRPATIALVNLDQWDGYGPPAPPARPSPTARGQPGGPHRRHPRQRGRRSSRGPHDPASAVAVSWWARRSRPVPARTSCRRSRPWPWPCSRSATSRPAGGAMCWSP